MTTAPLILKIDLGGDAPVYRQIVDALRHALVAGDIQPGHILPPVRQLAIDLGVHFNTVAEAYRILAAEGWLDLRRRRGALVLSRKAPARPDVVASSTFSRRLRELVAELRASGLSPAHIARELRSLAEGLEK
ncbi:MAG: GntR family transcriptional regulator [Bryobacteraceae bacterium]